MMHSPQIHHAITGKRPATISELAERANIPWDESRGFEYHLELAEKYRREAKEYARSGDMENAFVEFARAATLVLERLPEHPDYNAKLNPNQRHDLVLNGEEILESPAELKPGIVDRYEEWCLAQMDGADGYTTPIVPAQNGQEILDDLDELDPGILDRYEKCCQAQLDDVDGTSNVPTQQLADDNAMGTRVQQES